jgi:mannitol-1-phosphate 5-dehydrogenase
MASTNPGKIVVFGAGATGRGHVGLLAWQAGYQLAFVDKKDELVERLRRAGKYCVTLYGSDTKVLEVTGYKVFHSQDRRAIAGEIATSELALTAVFDQNLPDVARTVALAIPMMRKSGRRKPLNVLACENMMDSSSTLGGFVRAQLNEVDRRFCDTYFGFPDCMISRVVPQPGGDQLFLIGEDYNEWTARVDSFLGEKPPRLEALELVSDQTARLERKLFIHNGGHAVCGYVGFHRGHRFIHEALQDGVVVEHVNGVLDEMGEIVHRRHGYARESIEEYKRDLARRGALPQMQDEVLRVVRDPLRKLSPHERLVAPAKLAVQYGLTHEWIVKGIVAALKYSHSSDDQALFLADMLDQRGVHTVLSEVCDIEPESLLGQEILAAWSHWNL